MNRLPNRLRLWRRREEAAGEGAAGGAALGAVRAGPLAVHGRLGLKLRLQLIGVAARVGLVALDGIRADDQTAEIGRQLLRVDGADPALIVGSQAHEVHLVVEIVIDVHDLHVWTLTSEMENASVHLVVESTDDSHDVLDRARSLLQQRYGIGHATLQVEPADHEGCDELAW